MIRWVVEDAPLAHAAHWIVYPGPTFCLGLCPKEALLVARVQTSVPTMRPTTNPLRAPATPTAQSKRLRSRLSDVVVIEGGAPNLAAGTKR